jgi:hypothetical protein
VVARGDVPIPEGRSRSIGLLDYQVEKEFVDQVPHEVFFSAPQERPKPVEEPSKQIRRKKTIERLSILNLSTLRSNRNQRHLPSGWIVRSTRRALAKVASLIWR